MTRPTKKEIENVMIGNAHKMLEEVKKTEGKKFILITFIEDEKNNKYIYNGDSNWLVYALEQLKTLILAEDLKLTSGAKMQAKKDTNNMLYG